MGFRWIRSYHYRNLVDGEISLDSPEVFFVGENGQGKTNLLEALYLLCFGSSFRTNADTLLVRHGCDEMAVEGGFRTVESGGETAPDENLVELKYRPARRGGARKEIRVNEKLIRDRKELVSNIPCIVFSHEDIGFVTGAPDRRRWFFNQTMSLYEPVYIDLLRRYQKILRMRNQALKEQRRELLDIYDQQLAPAGLEIVERRGRTVREFDATFQGLFREISGIPEELSVHYLPSWRGCSSTDEALDLLGRKRTVDLELGTTTTGPHRDRFHFVLDRRNFARIASTGQLRLISLILRVAQARYFSEKSGRRPLLLLDDVLLELDMNRRERFFRNLPGAEQRLFTFLPDEQFRPFVGPQTLMYKVESGSILKL